MQRNRGSRVHIYGTPNARYCSLRPSVWVWPGLGLYETEPHEREAYYRCQCGFVGCCKGDTKEFEQMRLALIY